MIRNLLSKIFSSKIFYMIFSLLVAVALWMYVEISVNEESTFTIENVPVVFANDELLRDRGLLISSYSPQSVSLEFDCQRSAAYRLMNQKLSVEIDLETIKKSGPATLSYNIIYPTDFDTDLISAERFSVDRVSLIVDRVREWPVPVRVDYRGGTASDDLIAEEEIYDPQTIIVSGPEDVVSKIKSAYVSIPRERLSATYTGDLGFILMDEEGAEIDENLLDSVSTNTDSVHVIIPVNQIKNVPLSVALMNGAGATEQNTNIICEPSSIQVVGDPDGIRDINNITLGTIDTTRTRDMTITEAFPIIVPNYLANLSGETAATVTVEIMGLEVDYYSTSNLHVVNKPFDYSAEVRTQSLDVWIRGNREDLDQISLENIRVVADLTDMKPGTSRVQAKVYIDGIDADVGAVGDYRITVTLTRELT